MSAKFCGSTSVVITEPAPVVTPSPSVTGAIKLVFEPIKTSSPINSQQTFEFQNNYLVLPDSVLSVSNIITKSGFGGIGGGVPGVAMFNPFLVGGAGGAGSCGGMMYDMTSYYAMREYISLVLSTTDKNLPIGAGLFTFVKTKQFNLSL